MGSETVRLWSDCLGTLNLMLPNASRTELQVAAVTAAGDLMQVILQQLKKQPVLPKAKWKELIQDMKVPSKLGETLTKSVQQPQPLNSVTVAVLDLLMLLLTRGDADGSLTAASVNENSIASRTRCQLEQSGVPQALSAILTAAAAALPGEPAPFTPEQRSNTAGGSSAPAAATAAAGACAAGPTAQSHHASGRSRGGGSDSPDPSPVLKSAERSLMLVAALVRVWPDGTPLHRLSISLAGPMCQLSMACIHYVSAHVQGLQQPQKDQAFGLQTLLHRAVTVPLTVLSWRCGCMPEFVDAGIRGDAPLPGLRELLHTEHFILCLVLCNSVMALSLLFQDQQQGSSSSVNTGGSSSSSSQGSSGSKSGGKPTKCNKSSKGDAGASRTGAGSSSNSSSAAAAAAAASGSSAAGGTKREQDSAKQARMRAAAEGVRPEFGVHSLASWVRGCQLLPLLTSSHTKLFELLDVDPMVVLWAAESLTKPWAGIEERVSLYDGLGDMSRLYRQVFDGMLLRNGQAAAVLQEHTQLLPVAHMQRERLFVLLVPLVLLHTAANLPTGKGQEADLVACMCAAANSTPVLVHWDRLVQLLPRVPGDEWIQSRLPPVWVDDTISVMLQLATAMLAGIRRSQIPPAAADVATAKAGMAARDDSSSSGNGVSSSSSTSASRSVSASLQYAKDCVYRMQALESTVMTPWQVLTHCAKAAAACTEQLQAAAVPGVPAPTLCLNSPTPRLFQAALAAAPKAVRALEGYLRLLGMGFEGLHTSKSLTGWVGVILGCRDVLGTDAVVGLTWGGGWELQRNVYSMRSSSVKLARMQTGMLPGQLSWELCYSSCCAAAALLQQHRELPQVLLALPDAAAPSAAAAAEAAGGARQQADTTGSQEAKGGGVVRRLLSIVLLGRCCLFLAQQLQAESLVLLHTLGSSKPGSQLCGLQYQQDNIGWTCFAVRYRGPSEAKSRLQLFVGQFRSWLQRHAAEPTAAGYGVQGVIQQLDQLLSAQQAAASSTSETAGAALAAFAQQLHVTGLACCAVPVECFCNNPACSNVSGAIELVVVSGKSNMCGGCLVARYCSRECQTQHWKQHKPACKALAAAGSVATAAAGL